MNRCLFLYSYCGWWLVAAEFSPCDECCFADIPPIDNSLVNIIILFTLSPSLQGRLASAIVMRWNCMGTEMNVLCGLSVTDMMAVVLLAVSFGFPCISICRHVHFQFANCTWNKRCAAFVVRLPRSRYKIIRKSFLCINLIRCIFQSIWTTWCASCARFRDFNNNSLECF